MKANGKMEGKKVIYTSSSLFLDHYYIPIVGDSMDNALSIIIYKEGSREARNNELDAAFESYVDAFLSRLSGADLTLEFVSFYRYQLYSYLKAKPVFILSLPEGDMISDLILQSYEDFLKAVDGSPFNITGEGRVNLLESVRIPFPWQSDTDDEKDIL